MDHFSLAAAGSAAIRRFTSFWVIVIGLIVSFSPLTQAWNDWHAADAAMRFRLARPPRLRQSFTLRMDIGEVFSGHVVRGAYSANGTVLPTRPIRLAGKLIAVEIGPLARESGFANYVGSQDKTKFPDHTPVFLYLSESGSDNPVTISKRAPIACHTSYIKSITRPSGVNDLFTFWSRQSALSFRGDQRVGDNLERYISRRWRGTSNRSPHQKNSLCTRLEYSTSLVVKEKSGFQFGAEAAETAWFIFVNGEGVGAWETGKPKGGAILGDKVILSPGIHEFSLLAIIRPGETFPNLVYSVNDGKPVSLSPDQLAASHVPPAVRLEYQRGDSHPGVAISGGVVFLPELKGLCHTVTTTDLTWPPAPKGDSKRTTFTLKDGQAFGGDTVAVYGAAPRKLVVSGPFPAKRFPVSIPVFPQRPSAVFMSELVLERLPPMVSKTGILDISVKLQDTSTNKETKIPGFDPVLRVEMVGPAPKAIQVIEKPLTGLASFQTVTVSVNPAVKQIVLNASLAGMNVVKPVVIDILRPTSDLSHLVADGDRLRSGENLAILQVDGELASPSTKAPPMRMVSDGDTVTWVDTYLAKGAAGEQLSRRLGIQTAKKPYVINRLDDRYLPDSPVLPELRQFHLGARALSMKPAAIVWGIGPLDLAAGTHRDDIRRRQQFFAQASLARGIIPVLVTPPPAAFIDHEEGRAAALSLKRSGLKLGVPVMDVYSEAHALTGRDAESSFTEFHQLNSTISVDGVTPAGQDWYVNLLVRTLDKIVKK